MQIESLKIFNDVIKLQSFSKAAKLNNITQSSASQTINHIEQTYSTQLIDRTCRPFKLTPQGKLYYKGIKEILLKYSKLEHDIFECNNKLSEIIRIGSIYSAGLRHMKYYINKFSDIHPDADIHLEYLHPDEIYNFINEGKIDIGIISFPRSKSDLTVIPWKYEQMVAVFPKNSKIGNKKIVNSSDLAGLDFISLDHNLKIKKEIDKYLKKHNIYVNTVMEFDNIESIKRAVEIASGFSILPRPTLDREISEGLLKCANIENDNFTRPLCIIHKKNKKFNDYIYRFVNFLKEQKIKK